MRVEVVGLDAVEVVLGLRVDHAEHRVGVGLAVDVRDAPVVADDGDALRLLLPAGDVLVCGGLRRGRARPATTMRSTSFFMRADCAIKSWRRTMTEHRDVHRRAPIWHGGLDRANALLVDGPGARAPQHLHAAAILGDEAAVRRFLAQDPATATASPARTARRARLPLLLELPAPRAGAHAGVRQRRDGAARRRRRSERRLPDSPATTRVGDARSTAPPASRSTRS